MRHDRAFCKHCQYSLAGLTCNVCPECGTPFDLARRGSFSRRPRLQRWTRRVAVSVFGLALLYVTTYYCNVETQPPMTSGLPNGVVMISEGTITLELQPTYPFGGDLALLFYKPVHAIDRKLRSGNWSVPMGGPGNTFLWAGM